MSDYPRTLLEFQHQGDEFEDLHNEFVFRFNRRFWPMVAFDSVLKIATRVESLTYRDFYESARTDTNPPESDKPVLTG